MKSFRTRSFLSCLLLVACASAFGGERAESATRIVKHRIAPHMRIMAGTTLLNETFSGSSTPANAWLVSGTTCLTAGNGSTPGSSIPACGGNAPQDSPGQGAVQITAVPSTVSGLLVYQTPFATSGGLQITFTDYSFNGSNPGGNGMVSFLSDASHGIPTAPGATGGELGYAGQSTRPGLANAYLGVGFDETGNFSVAGTGHSGGPGTVPETIAVRGASSINYQYIGGYTNGSGNAASLPFALDNPGATTRPPNAPTIMETLTAGGQLTVSIDRHDGQNFVQYYTQSIVGVGGEPGVPATVFIGFTAANGSHFNRHQIGNLTVANLSGGGPSPLTVSPNSLVFAKPTSASQNASISGGTPGYSVSGCSGIATATVSGNGLTVSPIAAGNCSVTVKDSGGMSASVSVLVNAAGGGGGGGGSASDNLTFHQNNARTGWYQNETSLTTSNVGSLKNLGALQVNGKVYAQPLYVYKYSIGGQTRNLVVVATEANMVYAFDDSNMSLVWSHDYDGSGETPEQALDGHIYCGDVDPTIGITGTPVIDRDANEIYFVTATTDGNNTGHLRLHRASLQTGADEQTTEIQGSVRQNNGDMASVDPKRNMNRAALLEAGGNIYVGLGSHCDGGSATTHGWLFAYNAKTLAPTGSNTSGVNVTDDSPIVDAKGPHYLGSVWMSGFGPAADASSIYFATGNGPNDNGFASFGMSVLKVGFDLNLTNGQLFTPYNYRADSDADQDLGSGGVVLFDIAGSHRLVAGGKCGVPGGTLGCQKYILDRDALGGRQNNDAGAVWHGDTAGQMFGGPAYFLGSDGNAHIIYGGGRAQGASHAPLNSYVLSGASSGLTNSNIQGSANVGNLEGRDQGSQPIVSSNAQNAGTAVAWALQTPGNSGGPITLYAFDALNMNTLYHGVAGNWGLPQNERYTGGALVSPLVANGRVYVPTDGAVAVFGR